jgi:parvulin-like peptidyl-prolyl isomerase
MSYMNIYYRGNDYFNALYESVEYTDADIQDYYNRFADQLISQGLGKEHGSKVTARHILIEPANSTEEALDAAKQKAQDIMDQWIAAGAKEADFADLAKAHSDCPSAADGGNLGAFSKGQMVKEFEDWCFADGRKSGDYGLVQTQYGWHIIYIVDNNPVWYNAAKSGVINERLQAMMAEMEKNYPMTVDFENIVLADALMHK